MRWWQCFLVFVPVRSELRFDASVPGSRAVNTSLPLRRTDSVLRLYHVRGSRTCVLVLLGWCSLLQMLAAALPPSSPPHKVDVLQAQNSTHRAQRPSASCSSPAEQRHLLMQSVDGDGCPWFNAMLVNHMFPFDMMDQFLCPLCWAMRPS